MQPAIRWLRRPSARWVRLPAGLLLIVGSVFSILPVLGLWMLPLGVVLLAEDFAPLRRLTDRVLNWIERSPAALDGPPAGNPSRHPLALKGITMNTDAYTNCLAERRAGSAGRNRCRPAAAIC